MENKVFSLMLLEIVEIYMEIGISSLTLEL